MKFLTLQNITKVYPNGFVAVKEFNLEVNKGDFVALVGPSGCGKTTTLRMIAGLEEISSGEMILNGVLLNNLPPNSRDIGMVFQDYALYPHLCVYDNIGFSLIIRHTDKDQIHERVMGVAELVGLKPYLKRRPAQLSGGQRQRVALARTIARQPSLFLMDEPMSNLDAKLRNEMRVELVALHHKLNATTIYVTHDQVEAMTMANVLVVMNKGVVQQVGNGQYIYDYPENVFVASFIGIPTITLLQAKVKKGKIIIDNQEIILSPNKEKELKDYLDKEVIVGIRPEHFKLGQSLAKIQIQVEVVEMMGHESFIHASINNSSLIARIAGTVDIAINQKIELGIDIDKVHFFDKESEKRIRIEEEKQ